MVKTRWNRQKDEIIASRGGEIGDGRWEMGVEMKTRWEMGDEDEDGEDEMIASRGGGNRQKHFTASASIARDQTAIAPNCPPPQQPP